jgi:hypothetical protein
MHRKCDMMHTHPILFVSRVEFMQAILAAAVRKSCVQDVVTILQYGQGAAGFNLPFCGLIQGVSSRQRSAGTVLPTAVITCHVQTYSQTAGTVLPTAVITCHGQTYSQTAGRHFEVSVSHLTASLALANTEGSTKCQSKTPISGMIFLNLVSQCNDSLTL